MPRIDFGLCFFENVEELVLFVFLHAWAQAYICNSILAYVGMFLRFCVHGNGPTYTGSCLRAWALTRVHEMPGRSPILPIFTPFSIVSLPYANLTHLFVIFASKCHCIILFIFTLTSKRHMP